MSPAQAAEWQASRARLVARAQMYTNAVRGLAYLPRIEPGASGASPKLKVQVRKAIPLDGDPIVNVRSNVYPIDADGDGDYELLQFNGFRFMRLFEQDGTLIWERFNGSGRVHRSPVHRDTLAILDVDGDGAQEIFHCWSTPGSGNREVVLRDGATGDVIRSKLLAGDKPGSECQIAAFRMEGSDRPVVLVSRTANSRAGCSADYVDIFSSVTAFDPSLNEKWTRATCEAGHYSWPVDANADGIAEAAFVGKYLFGANGDLRCTLSGWGRDHIDSMLVADLNAGRGGHEVIAVGRTGTRAYDAANCSSLWNIPPSRIGNPQTVQAAHLDGSSAEPAIFIDMKNGNNRRTFRLNGRGTGLTPLPYHHIYQTTNLDGVGGEDRVGQYGVVYGNTGGRRLDVDWLNAFDRSQGVNPNIKIAERWAFNPLLFDLDGDGRDEVIMSSRRSLIVADVLPASGGASEPAPEQEEPAPTETTSDPTTTAALDPSGL
jgi:hypothetical protein